MTQSAALAAQLLTFEYGHVPVPLQRCDGAQLLWTHPRLGVHLRQARIDLPPEDASQWVLQHAAFVVPKAGAQATHSGIADRYGGFGIGHNGGSGRAVLVNGLHIKGVGRTPLVATNAPAEEAGGAMSLVEGLRELAYALALERVLGEEAVVPVLALVDLDLQHCWEDAIGSHAERRVLIVRPPFLRPAHALPAPAFVGPLLADSSLDRERAQRMVEALRTSLGDAQLVQRLQQGWRRWAQRLAQAHARQLLPGSVTPSNVTLDGELLDFGSASGLPGWCRTAIDLHRYGHEALGLALQRAVRQQVGWFGRLGVEPWLRTKAAAEQEARQVVTSFERSLLTECLCVLWPANEALPIDACFERLGSFIPAARRLLHACQDEGLDLYAPGTEPGLQFAPHEFWSEPPASAFRELRACLDPLVSAAQRARWLEAARARSEGQRQLWRPELTQFAQRAFGCDPEAVPSAAAVNEWLDAALRGLGSTERISLTPATGPLNGSTGTSKA
jgi:hypothetical protein